MALNSFNSIPPQGVSFPKTVHHTSLFHAPALMIGANKLIGSANFKCLTWLGESAANHFAEPFPADGANLLK